jgi:hypothetical protein
MGATGIGVEMGVLKLEVEEVRVCARAISLGAVSQWSVSVYAT